MAQKEYTLFGRIKVTVSEEYFIGSSMVIIKLNSLRYGTRVPIVLWVTTVGSKKGHIQRMIDLTKQFVRSKLGVAKQTLDMSGTILINPRFYFYENANNIACSTADGKLQATFIRNSNNFGKWFADKHQPLTANAYLVAPYLDAIIDASRSVPVNGTPSLPSPIVMPETDSIYSGPIDKKIRVSLQYFISAALVVVKSKKIYSDVLLLWVTDLGKIPFLTDMMVDAAKRYSVGKLQFAKDYEEVSGSRYHLDFSYSKDQRSISIDSKASGDIHASFQRKAGLPNEWEIDVNYPLTYLGHHLLAHMDDISRLNNIQTVTRRPLDEFDLEESLEILGPPTRLVSYNSY